MKGRVMKKKRKKNFPNTPAALPPVPKVKLWKCNAGHVSLGEPNGISVTGFEGIGALNLKFCWWCVAEHVAKQFPIRPVD